MHRLDVGLLKCFDFSIYQFINLIFSMLGPLYSMDKVRDHRIVRALETHPKAVPLKVEVEYCVVMGLQV